MNRAIKRHCESTPYGPWRSDRQGIPSKVEGQSHFFRAAVLVFAVVVVVGFIRPEAASANEKAGTTVMQFLKLGIGGRACAMGEAGTAAAEGVAGMYWNPASLNGVGKREVMFMHGEWFQDVRYEFLGYGQEITDGSWLGCYASYLNYGELILTKEDTGGLHDEEEDGTFNAWDLLVALSYAEKLSYNWYWGMTGKVVMEENATVRATGYALDAGIIYRFNPERMSLLPERIGLSVRNLGLPVKFEQETASLPVEIRLGSCWTFNEAEQVASLDIAVPFDNNVMLHAGGEWWLGSILAIRAGYKYRIGKNDLGYLAGLTAGVGLKIKKFGLDFAFVPYGDLGETYRVSLKWDISGLKEVDEGEMLGARPAILRR